MPSPIARGTETRAAKAARNSVLPSRFDSWSEIEFFDADRYNEARHRGGRLKGNF